MNIETQMLLDRIKQERLSFETEYELKAFTDIAQPAIFGWNEKGQWSWRLAREQKEKVDWKEILKLIQSDILVS